MDRTKQLLYDATAVGSGFVPGSGLMDFIGQAPAIGGGTGPSFVENIRNKQYLDAFLQTAGAAGDAMMVVPPVGLGIKAATTAGKTARALGNLPVKPSTDDAGQVMGRNGLPTEMLGATAQGTQSQAVRRVGNLRVTPSSDDVNEVMDASFRFASRGGNRTMPIEQLTGGVRMTDAKEAERVKSLAERMSGPEGFVSRLVVDDAGNVLEGQHRLEALRMLGQKDVPVTVIQDLSRKYNTDAMEQAAFGMMRRDQANQMVRNAIDALEDSGSVEKALQEYVMPPQFQKQFEAVLRASQRKN